MNQEIGCWNLLQHRLNHGLTDNVFERECATALFAWVVHWTCDSFIELSFNAKVPDPEHSQAPFLKMKITGSTSINYQTLLRFEVFCWCERGLFYM